MNAAPAAWRTHALLPAAGRLRDGAAAHTELGRAAVAALHDELSLAPKPGLVSFVDSGSHADMDTRTFMRSLFALRHAWPQLAALGAAGAPFEALAAVGVAAETRMLRATGGVNTHRGAIFCLGLLCAAAGAVAAQRRVLQPREVQCMLVDRWGPDLAHHAAAGTASHGSRAARTHGLRGAAGEAAAGFPVLFNTTAPALRAALAAGATPQQAQLQALLATVAVLDDTTLVHRGGIAGLRHAQHGARHALAMGGALTPTGRDCVAALHADFVSRRLSPGGAADLLAAACWLQRVCTAGG